MIVIFGGTTEGRKAVAVCDEAGKPYYYSTKGDLQKIEAANAIFTTGALDEESMRSFCAKNDIRLIIDAAHPFAETLHQHIAAVSHHAQIPVIRLERNYPERDKELLWFDSYDHAIEYLESNHIENLLALTGVNTLAKLKPYWLKHNCLYRILNRDESRAHAEKEGFPLSRILYYKHGDDETTLFKRLKPEAIITKESGASGGFQEKIEAARTLNIPVLVVKRPPLPQHFISVYGENGLRKQIEALLPDFFNLKTGYTTGTCATAATKAALLALLTKEQHTAICITLPNGEKVKISLASTQVRGEEASCTVIKDAGDDPDITNGQEIVSTVKLSTTHRGVHFLQGVGVGRVTLPGLGLKIGEPAINKTPRMMMAREIANVMRRHPNKLPPELKTGVDVTISVPNGAEIARRTFNPKLGIVGGISIIGTSGVVKPFSATAFIDSIRREMQVAKALGCTHVVINSGAKSERFVKQQFPTLPPQAFIHYGNFIGETVAIASELGMVQLTLGIMLGKAVKLAEGFLDTHSKKVVMNTDFLATTAQQAGCSAQTAKAIRHITMARQLWSCIPPNESAFFLLILEKCYEACKPLFSNGELSVLLIDESGAITTNRSFENSDETR